MNEKKAAPSAKSLMETKVWIKSDPHCGTLTKRLVDYNPESMICAFDDNTDACQVCHIDAVFALTQISNLEFSNDF